MNYQFIQNKLVVKEIYECLFLIVLDISKITMSEEIQSILRQTDDRSYDRRCLIGFADPMTIVRALESGKTLGDGQLLDEYDLNDIHPETLELHFDSCISAERNEIDELLASFDYRSLLPTATESSESVALKKMSEIPELHHLFVHPLISSFIYLKWCRMRIFCYLNLGLVSLFCLNLAGYVYLSNTTTWYKYLIKSLLIILYLILLAREFLQLVHLKLRYFREPSNLIELKLLSVCFYVIFIPAGESFKQVCAVSILMSVLQLGMLAKRHPRLSVPIIMLRKVTQTFLYFLLWYSILFLGFVLSFYELSQISESEDNYNSANSESYNTTNNIVVDNKKVAQTETTFLLFISKVFLTFFDTVIMLTGELGAEPSKVSTWAHKLVFLLFVFMITIVLVNLLCGLAVWDIQIIRMKSEETRYIETATYLSNTEEFVISLNHFLFNLKRLEKLYNFFNRRFYVKVFLETRQFENICVNQSNKNPYIEQETVKKLKYFLLQNQNAEIINQLREISNNRETIRDLIGTGGVI